RREVPPPPHAWCILLSREKPHQSKLSLHLRNSGDEMDLCSGDVYYHHCVASSEEFVGAEQHLAKVSSHASYLSTLSSDAGLLWASPGVLLAVWPRLDAFSRGRDHSV